ncbi:PepSY domain-containing protein [uncultured Algimonas sp.]|uniref:PepSY-associated TM helix domain-containing protein n=1 Tax=uncultured Algimonas sp. TaxID=1547920 RepID=UPI00262A3C76|nr:PepSY domain-containing protein [uncultured Algimonas sp.]
MTRRSFQLWSAVHSWTSLICTAFLLMLCVTGLPLIFHHEIDAALSPDTWRPADPGGPLLSYDAVLDAALANRPGEVPLYMSFDVDRPVVNVTTGPAPDAPQSQMHFASFDRTSGNLVPPPEADGGVMDVVLRLHTDMFLGLPGMLFLGAMGALFIAALVSGVVLYAPFMQKHAFGMVRTHKSRRLKWLDLHNLLGIATMAWVFVVGLTGVVNTLEAPINAAWKAQAFDDLTGGYGDAAVTGDLASLDAAISAALDAAPGMTLQFVAFPGGSFSTNRHFFVFLHGSAPLTREIITPVLIDARTGELVGLRDMPWYAKGLSLSRPLHFGDYGGLPLKILWAILTLFTIVVLGSGLYLWIARRRTGRGRNHNRVVTRLDRTAAE